MTPGIMENIKEHSILDNFSKGHLQRFKKLWYVVKCFGLLPSVRRMLVTVREPGVRIAPALKNKKFSNVGCEKIGANFSNMFIMLDESCSCITPSVVFDPCRSIIHARASFLTFYPEKMSKVETILANKSPSTM